MPYSLGTDGDRHQVGGRDQDQDRDDETPWTFVIGAGGRRNRRRNHAGHRTINHPPTPSLTQSSATGSAITVDASAAALEHIQMEHARIVLRWKRQPSYQQLEQLIATNAPRHVSITQALCLGAGSFGGLLDAGEAIRRAHLQTAAFLSIVRQLELYSGHTIPCFFQEPMYTDADKKYLRGMGHCVVEAPAASRMVTSATLVFAIHLPTKDYLDCISGVFPAMLAGTDYGCYEGLPQFSSAKAPRTLESLRRLHDTHDRFKFPREQHDYCFSDTSIYWRPAADAGLAADNAVT